MWMALLSCGCRAVRVDGRPGRPRSLDRSDARVGGEAVPVGETTDVTGVADDREARTGPTRRDQ